MGKYKSKKARKIEIIVFGIITLILLIYGHINNKPTDILNPTAAGTSAVNTGAYENGVIQASFIDIGQGDSSFIKLSSGENILIDGGDKGSGEALRRYFADNSINKLDAAIVSHYHADHAEGIYELMNEFHIDIIYMPNVKTRPELHDDLVRRADKKGIKIKYIASGDKITFKDGTVFDVLFPDEGIFSNIGDNGEANINNDSLVIKVSYGETDFLFTGDLESDAEKALVKSSNNLDCEVLKVGHHGSKTSSSKVFLNAVTPEYAVISAGRNNRYKHPHGQVLDRLESFGIKIYRTDLSGNITVVADSNGVTDIKTEYSQQEGN